MWDRRHKVTKGTRMDLVRLHILCCVHHQRLQLLHFKILNSQPDARGAVFSQARKKKVSGLTGTLTRDF
jgi:hypothetical protein